MCSEKSSLKMFIVDAFTDKPFRGNSAGVCLVPYDQVISNDVKQKIAEEMNQSETAFISPTSEKDTFQSGNRFHLSWFTPKCEVNLCGHATLATAAVLFFDCNNKADILEFETLSGVLAAKKLSSNSIQIDLPAYRSNPAQEKYKDVVKAVVGNLPTIEVVLSESKKLLIRLSDNLTRDDLEGIRPSEDAKLMSAAPDIVGVIVTLKGSLSNGCVDKKGNAYDFVSRYFAPWMGISEDPVTGSAHSVLVPYYAEILKKNKFYARQCSPRGGELHIEHSGSRVFITGSFTAVLRGNISF